MLKLIDLYVYHVTESGRLSILLLKRSGSKIYSGQWRMIGGKAEADETRWRAALRELKEETGLTPDLFWSVPTLNHFYEHQSDQIHLIPAFAARVDGEAEIRLDDEHDLYRWVDVAEISGYVFWPEQKRIIDCIEKIVMNQKILKEWIIPADTV